MTDLHIQLHSESPWWCLTETSEVIHICSLYPNPVSQPSVSNSSNFHEVPDIFLAKGSSILYPNSSHNWIFPTLNLMATDLTCTAKCTYSPAFQTQHPASFHETNGPRSQCRCRLCRLGVARVAELAQVLEIPREQTASCMSLMTLLAQINVSPVRVHSFKPSN